MIVKDESGFLENSIQSIKDIADELIIIDNGSKDDTKEIAKRYTKLVYDFPQQGDFSAIRNFSISKATSNWILVIDADEILDTLGKAELLKLINTREYCLKNIIGFKLDQRTHLPKSDGAKMTASPEEITKNFDGYVSSKIVRLFKNHPKIMFRNKVHELVENSIRENGGELIDTGIILHHFSNLKKKTAEKMDTYTEIMWKQLQEEPKNPRYNRQIADAFLSIGKKELALKYFIRTLKLDPKHPGIYADLGKIYLEMGEVSRSIRFFNMAIAQNMKDTASMNNLAVIYMKAGKLDIAKKIMETALKIEPKNKYLLLNNQELNKLLNKK